MHRSAPVGVIVAGIDVAVGVAVAVRRGPVVTTPIRLAAAARTRSRAIPERKPYGRPQRERRAVAVSRRITHPHRPHDDVAGCVTDVHHRGRVAVNIDVGDVMDRAAWRDGVNRRGHAGCHRPRTERVGRDEPHPALAGVVTLRRHHDHRRRCVGRIAKRRAGNRHKARCPGIRHLQFGLLALDRRRLRNRVGDYRLLRLRGAGHRHEHVGFLAVGQDLLEITGQAAGRDERPRPVQIARLEPAPRNQDVVIAVVKVVEQGVARVPHVEQVRAGDRQKVGSAGSLEQFGRDR